MKKRTLFAILLIGSLVAALAVGLSLTDFADDGSLSTTQPPPDMKAKAPVYVQGPSRSHAPVIRVYKNFNAWFGENRDDATLVAIPANGGLGKILDDDYFIHPLSDLSTGIPAGTAVVFLSSNSVGGSTSLDFHGPEFA